MAAEDQYERVQRGILEHKKSQGADAEALRGLRRVSMTPHEDDCALDPACTCGQRDAEDYVSAWDAKEREALSIRKSAMQG